MYGGRFLTSKMEAWSAQRLDVKLRAAGWRPASSGAPLAAHPIMPVQVARRRANSRRGRRVGRREKRGRTVNFNDELGGLYTQGLFISDYRTARLATLPATNIPAGLNLVDETATVTTAHLKPGHKSYPCRA